MHDEDPTRSSGIGNSPRPFFPRLELDLSCHCRGPAGVVGDGSFDVELVLGGFAGAFRALSGGVLGGFWVFGGLSMGARKVSGWSPPNSFRDATIRRWGGGGHFG